ncbi:hypothetical protein VPH35_113173 [Triticum aestivum]
MRPPGCHLRLPKPAANHRSSTETPKPLISSDSELLHLPNLHHVDGGCIPAQRPCASEPLSQLPIRLALPCQALGRRLAGQVLQRLVSPLLPHRSPQDPSVLHVLPDEPPRLVPLQPPQGAKAGGPGRRQLQQAHGQYVRAARPKRQRQRLL